MCLSVGDLPAEASFLRLAPVVSPPGTVPCIPTASPQGQGLPASAVLPLPEHTNVVATLTVISRLNSVLGGLQGQGQVLRGHHCSSVLYPVTPVM